jgi:hypothetical protein
MRSIVFLALFAACVPTSYTYSPTVNRTTAREANCEFTILANSPDEAFDELGTLKHYNGDIPMQEADFRKAIGPRVCEVGGHAVIANRTSAGAYQTATVIRYTKGFHR